MLFNSPEFIVFFIIVTTLYFLTSGNVRWLMLLVASSIFYMYFIPYYILILAALIIVDFTAGIFIWKSTGAKRKLILTISLIANIGFLCFFKYFNFLSADVASLSNLIGWNYSPGILEIVLPIGLSFHTFQAMSYTIEVYRKKFKPEKNFIHYALYVLFYPQLVAGPIERPNNLLPQFRIKHVFNSNRVIEGLRLMGWGLFKKVIIADRLALFSNQIFGNYTSYDGVGLAIGILAFSFQIYCDFSGYTDIARGAARVMGIDLMLNFRKPYLSQSINEFWKRWHISLSSWFRDYLYIPLGGNRKGSVRTVLNILIVFFVSGMWHGANWTFGAWGLMHGLLLIGSRALTSLESKLPQLKLNSSLVTIIKVLLTFSLVSLAWVFFRATSIDEAFHIFSNLPTGWIELLSHITNYQYLDKHIILGFSKWHWIIISASLALMFFVEQNSENGDFNEFIVKTSKFFRWGIYYAILIMLLLFSAPESNQFIYFQF